VAGLRVNIHINKGRVDVSGGPFDEVDVDDEEGLTVHRHPDRVEIHGNTADCLAYVPESAHVKVHANSAEVSVLAVSGLEVHVNDGEIDAADVTGPVKLHGNTLEVSLENVDGPVAVQANRGDVFVRVPEGARVRADIRVDHGDVVNDVPTGSDVELRVRLNRGEVTITDAAAG
jgi:hypothetical protein